MTKTLALLGAAAILFASAALAQPAPPPPPGGPRPGPEAGAPPPPPPPGGHQGGPRGLRGGPDAPPPKAAQFRLERGDTALDIRCAADEPMKACADIALQLLDKLAAIPAPPPAPRSRD